jgi:hypothetical protein
MTDLGTLPGPPKLSETEEQTVKTRAAVAFEAVSTITLEENFPVRLHPTRLR